MLKNIFDDVTHWCSIKQIFDIFDCYTHSLQCLTKSLSCSEKQNIENKVAKINRIMIIYNDNYVLNIYIDVYEL